MTKNLKVKFAVDLTTLQGEKLKERAGADTVRQALLEAGVSPMMLDTAMGMLRSLWGTGGEPKETVITAQAACMAALQLPDQTLTGAERLDRMRLALKIIDPDPVEITEKEKEVILKAIEKAYSSPVVYYRINELFEKAIIERGQPVALAI